MSYLLTISYIDLVELKLIHNTKRTIVLFLNKLKFVI